MFFNQCCVSNQVLDFAELAFNSTKIQYNEAVLEYFDFDRICLNVDGKPFVIRCWNINNDGIRYSVYDDDKELIHSYICQIEYADV